MWAVPHLPDVDKIEWSELPNFRGESGIVFRGIPGDSGHMHVPSICFFEGQYFAAWNDGFILENRPGQRVRFATSSDGLHWSPPSDLTGRHPKRGYTNCGFWSRDGELFALAALRDARDTPSGEDPLLLAYPWDRGSGRFGGSRVVAKDFFAQNIPQRTPDGEWLILGKSGSDSWATMKSATGGVSALNDWKVRDLPPSTHAVEEPEWYTLPNGHLVGHFRTRPVHRLMRSYSVDNGVTWTRPILTTFPEASARHHGMRLSNGLYVLLVNPNTSGSRVPFSIALSKDGLSYDRIANARADPPVTRDNSEKPGYNYMRGFEHDSKLLTIYSLNQQEIGVIPLSEFEALYRPHVSGTPSSAGPP